MPHTPEPWTAIKHDAVNGNDYILILAGSWDIAHNKFSARNWNEERCNGAVMAQAPRLLRLCRQSLDLIAILLPLIDEHKWQNIRARSQTLQGELAAAITTAETPV